MSNKNNKKETRNNKASGNNNESKKPFQRIKQLYFPQFTEEYPDVTIYLVNHLHLLEGDRKLKRNQSEAKKSYISTICEPVLIDNEKEIWVTEKFIKRGILTTPFFTRGIFKNSVRFDTRHRYCLLFAAAYTGTEKENYGLRLVNRGEEFKNVTFGDDSVVRMAYAAYMVDRKSAKEVFTKKLLFEEKTIKNVMKTVEKVKENSKTKRRKIKYQKPTIKEETTTANANDDENLANDNATVATA